MMGRFRARAVPYFLALPGSLWMVVFFVIPIVAMVSLSLTQGDLGAGFQQTFHWQNYTDGISTYHVQLLRSLEYGLISTILQIAIAYPVAYWIAFRGGARKSMYLFLILLPFFVSFVLRTESWKFMLSDNGIILGTLKTWHLMPQGFHVLATMPAVIAGLTYNYLPFTYAASRLEYESGIVKSGLAALSFTGAQIAAHPVMSIKAAQDKPAAVKEHH